MTRIAASILSADFANLEKDLESITSSDLIHVDVMDGHFVPNLTIGLPVVARLQEVSKVPLDVHLMIDKPDRWAPMYADTGAFSVTFHFEACSKVAETIKSVRNSGSKVGLALKPGTELEEVESFLADIDMLLIMMVEPGFGGQSLMESVIPKISEAKTLARDTLPDLSIQVDGGIKSSNIEKLAEAGADTFVAGQSIMSASDRNAEIALLRELAQTSAS
jgi:ribulose-phosphate 3-epimerase